MLNLLSQNGIFLMNDIPEEKGWDNVFNVNVKSIFGGKKPLFEFKFM